MSKVDAWLMKSAAQEASKAAVLAREYAELLDDYANCLLDPSLEDRSRELRRTLDVKNEAITKAIHESDQWRFKK